MAKNSSKPLRDMSNKELKRLRVILRILPDGTLWATEEGAESLERNVASWNPSNRPDRTDASLVGGYIMNVRVSDTADKWLREVSEKFDLNEDDIVAESWHGGGLRHKGVSPRSLVIDLQGRVKRVDKRDKMDTQGIEGIDMSRKTKYMTSRGVTTKSRSGRTTTAGMGRVR